MADSKETGEPGITKEEFRQVVTRYASWTPSVVLRSKFFDYSSFARMIVKYDPTLARKFEAVDAAVDDIKKYIVKRFG